MVLIVPCGICKISKFGPISSKDSQDTAGSHIAKTHQEHLMMSFYCPAFLSLAEN